MTGLNEIVRTFTATDACGNTAFATQIITFADDEAPMGSVEDATVACATTRIHGIWCSRVQRQLQRSGGCFLD